MEPIDVYPCIYVLELANDCWYVGITYNFNLRMSQHWSGEGGAIWTRLHKPKRIARVIYPATGGKKQEDEITIEMKLLYGNDAVRGGRWCKV